MAIAGVILSGIALTLDTSAPGADVYNLGRLQSQTLTFIAGCAIAVVGVALAAAGEVRDTIRCGVNFLEVRREPTSKPAGVAISASDHPPSTQPPVDEQEQAAIDARLARGQQADLVGYIIVGVILVAVSIVGLALRSHP